MTPRTERQREVVRLSSQLPPITDKQRQYAIGKCFPKVAYYTERTMWCSCCGHPIGRKAENGIFKPVGGKTDCPWCGERLATKKSRRTQKTERWYYSIVTTCKGWQVFRHFIAERKARKGHPTEYFVRECVQNWIAPDGHEEVMARPTVNIPCIYDAWNFQQPLALKDRNRRVLSYIPDKYDVDAAYTYPRRRLLPIVRRNGYTGRCKTLSGAALVKLLLTDREAEGMAKNGQFWLLGWKWAKGYREFCMPYAHSIRVATRNGYIVKDPSMWFDYLDLLVYFHRDTHNARYVCPENLKAEHDRLMKRKQRIEERKAEEQRRKDAAKWEARYKHDKARYFGVCFGNSHIVVTVIQSVGDMAEEGKAMHHCVFANGYYKKADSLILTARSKDGERIETVEVSLRTFKVVQSRGVCNQNTPYHDEIIKLVNDNIELIKQAA